MARGDWQVVVGNTNNNYVFFTGIRWRYRDDLFGTTGYPTDRVSSNTDIIEYQPFVGKYQAYTSMYYSNWLTSYYKYSYNTISGDDPDVAGNQENISTTFRFDQANNNIYYYLTQGNLSSGNPMNTASSMTSRIIQVPHCNDGTSKLRLYFYFAGNSATYFTYAETNQVVTLETIPRASQIGVSNADIGSNTNIVINKANDNFTTTLWYKATGQNDWTKIIDKTNLQVYAWTVPVSFYSLIPNSKTISCEFKAETYSGNTLIGDKTTTATFTATGSPIINSSTAIDINSETINLTGDSSKMIKYVSNVKVSISTTAQNNSSISSIKVNGYEVTNNEITFLNTGTNLFVIDVTDSRGYITSETITMNMVDYIPVKINIYDIDRNQNTDGKIKISYTGVFFNGSFGTSANSLTMQYRYKEKGGNFVNWITLTPTISNNSFSQSNLLIDNFNYQKQFEFELRATDALGYDEILGIPIKKGETIWDWDESKFNVNVPIKKQNVDLDNIYLKQVGGVLTGNLTVPNLTVSNMLNSNDGSFTNSLQLNGTDVLTTSDLPVMGSNANGSWIKFSNGILICMNIIEDDYAMTTQWGNLYETAISSTAGATTFPIEFTSKPYLAVSHVANGWGGIIGDITYDKTGISRVNFRRTTSSSSTLLTYSYIAIGKWKEE